MGNITPQMLDQLAREGADSIVEACIMNGDVVEARLQTSLQYAWDQADPLANADVLNRQSTTGDLHVMTAGAAPTPVRADSPLHSMERYAQLCVRELGEIPFFVKQAEGKYASFDCRDHAIEGVESAVLPQSIVTTAKNTQGTYWTLLCRGSGTNAKRFNDIAMIGHDPKTGKTCFFQNKLFDGTDGARIPHPADIEKSRHVWDQPKGYCMGCHSADPFIHTAWIDGARRGDGSTIVPMVATKTSPYSVVNRDAQASARIGGSSWEMPKQLVSDGARACTSCHRIGGGDAMRRFPMSDVASFHTTTTENWADAKYAAAIALITACAADPQAAGCVWGDVPGASQGQP
jgi:hypothetical protein